MRLYPKEWRARYGDEFSELLEADFADLPRAWVRDVDVTVGAITARLAGLGLAGTTVHPGDRPRRSLGTLGCSLAVFLGVAVSIWSQLNIARRWADPAATATNTAIVIMTIAVALCAATVAVGAIPVAWTAAVIAVRRPEMGLRRPALLVLIGTAVLVVGAWHFHNGWSDTGGPLSSRQSMGPGGATAFMWISTLAVSAYWAHPTVLFSFPISEIAWMVISPVAVVLAVTGVVRILRRVDLPTRLFRFVSYLARIAVLGLGLFLFGTLTWLIDGGPGPGNHFQAGNVDMIGLVVMGIAFTAAARSAQRTAISPTATSD